MHVTALCTRSELVASNLDKLPSHQLTRTYVDAIRGRQPQGPYALAGYSYGSMLAFEMAKVLESEDGPGAVAFLGIFNLPPHIKTRMRYLNWNMCFWHLAFFLGLTTEEVADAYEEDGFRDVSPMEALETVLRIADLARLADLGLSSAEIIW